MGTPRLIPGDTAGTYNVLLREPHKADDVLHRGKLL